MPITVNNGGVLHTLKKITVNDYGTLYPLKTVHSNNNGVLYKIFSEEKTYKLAWESGDSDYEILSTSENGLTMKFRSTKDRALYPENYTKNVYCQLTIESTTSIHLSIKAIGSYQDKSLGVESYGYFEDETITFDPGTYYISAMGAYDDSDGSSFSDFIVEITIL